MNRPLVIKIGGDLIADRDRLFPLVSALAELIKTGEQAVVIHGGGPQATALTKRLHLAPTLIGGRRVTSPEVLEIMKMSLAGSVNVDLVAAAQAAGIRALGLSAISAGIIKAVKRPPRVISGCGPDPVDFGEVGDVAGVDKEALSALLEAGFVPLVSSLAATQEGRVLNINGDVVACHVAGALKARCLVLITGVDGVFQDLNDPLSRFPRLTIREAENLIQEGVVAAGMIPKLEEAFKCLRAGVGKVRICSVNREGFLREALSDSLEYGTALVM